MTTHVFVPSRWFDIVPSDTVRVSGSHTGVLCRAIRCNTAGSVKIGWADGSTTTFTMAQGDQISGSIFMVYATGTTGTYHGAYA